MKYFQDLIKIDKSADVPVYLQVTNAIIHQIRSGRLRKGLKLPGSRRLVGLLAINRMTVVAAYDELQAQVFLLTNNGYAVVCCPLYQKFFNAISFLRINGYLFY